ncbi:glucose 1-dehydrogenase [Frankia sp. CNm7]|uniref:Glucose 1-dehydrogenase n=1 Tax=Frankia nepalensis TaxID=1836974 RepID=A0A937RM95_9ACTN|nr:glucose 1-dehydrogenase [Frankia nepalensis]MBL7500640.1 glucose 1-dehydrogenase [Frankia nepalensis]MBL7511399.1 glucose 1-dehydrogenase [Frankia nepalensis]MBL7521768.1 glucose 1-dehydrogenase [Frankia nepalensis]MBL7631495.1 glucose 1-dehydrogenase [Frankia nepalensis]
MSAPVVVITGALTGIGRATACAYARQGADLVVSGRHQDVGDQLAEELRDHGAQAEFVCADVRREQDVRNVVDKAVDRFGRLDIAFNNAGTEGKIGPVTEVTDEGYQSVFDTNVKGTLLCLKHEFRVMKEQGGGSIVNVSSIFGLMGYPDATVYAGSKHAVSGITKAAALEGAAHGIRVNAVAPGYTRTAMYERVNSAKDRDAIGSVLPVHRPGTPEEIAEAVQYLASDKAGYITGQVLTVDGGLMAGWPLFPES